MQVDLRAHPDAFATLEQAFDPAANVEYGTRFLRRLRDGVAAGNWFVTVGFYHSQTPAFAAEYQAQVAAVAAGLPPRITAGHFSTIRMHSFSDEVVAEPVICEHTPAVSRCGGTKVETIAPFKITVCGLDELADHCETGASHVLSILDPDHPVPEAFGRFGEHEKLELRFHDVIEEDPGMEPPREADVARLLAFGRDLSREPWQNAHLLVHCHAGISRSTASMALILAQALPDLSGHNIMSEVLHIRPKAWPNLRIIEIGDGLLGRHGEIVAAAVEVYRKQLEIRPHLAEFMTLGGRGREVASAHQLFAGASANVPPCS
jgi:predicted protein tyrosine phosphatase